MYRIDNILKDKNFKLSVKAIDKEFEGNDTELNLSHIIRYYNIEKSFHYINLLNDSLRVNFN